MNHPSAPAFPVPTADWQGHGLTKRELIAAMAMQGIRATMTNGHARYADVAESAVAQAEALLARLERSP